MVENADLPLGRAINDRFVRRDDFVKLLSDFVDTVLYSVPASGPRRQPAVSYSDNKKLWGDILQHVVDQGSRVELQAFLITEWVPSAPGRYFTGEAEEARRRAQRYWERSRGEYLPLGKEEMVLGGVGCLRLRARHIDGFRRYILAATANGVAHEGLPVVLPDYLYDRVAETVKTDARVAYNLHGTLQVLPPELSLVRYDRDLLRVALAVEDVEIASTNRAREVTATVAIMFPSSYHTYGKPDLYVADGYETHFRKSWSYVSFNPDRNDRELQSAVTWLEDYAMRYSQSDKVPILADFDEHRSHFPSPVEFPLASLGHSLNLNRLEAYADFYNFTINVGALIVGDIFQNIADSTIVNRSTVERSFNAVQGFSPDVARALLSVAEHVAASGNKEAGELFNAFSDETAKPEPKRSLQRSLWSGLIASLPSITELTEAAQKIMTLFA